jgi:hypothetical protein
MNTCLSLFCLFFLSCTESNHPDLLLNKLKINKSDYDEYLINRSNGIHRLGGINEKDSTWGIIATHGYYPMGWSTKGFEWVSPIVELSHRQIPIWFFKYDWDDCPENSADYLYRETKKLIGNNSHLDSLWIIGHSLGGVVTSLFAEKWDREFPITIHSIAAPLAGMDSRGPDCENISKKVYKISSAVSYTQWKTVHAQDGAFRNLKFDPQEVFIDGGTSILLPGKWKNSRLGHNRSIQWLSENL